MYPKLVEANQKALRLRESAWNQVRAEGGSRNSESDLERFYQLHRNNPQELVKFAAANVGPERAAQEAARFARHMERRLGNHGL